MPARKTLEQVNQDLAVRGRAYEVLEYAGRHGKSLVRHTPSGVEGRTSVGDLLRGQHPSWSPECKHRMDLTAEGWSLRLTEDGAPYEVLEYAGSNGQSLVRHIPSGVEGRTRVKGLLGGQHPSWSPECKHRKNLTAEDWSLRLNNIDMPYEVLEYAGSNGQSLVRHTPSGVEGRTVVDSLLGGGHPSWSPECRSRRDLTAEDWTLRLAEAGMPYNVLQYAGCDGQSLVQHTLSGVEGRTRVGSLLKGHHPSWSPECKNRRDLTAEDWTLRLTEAGMRYEILEYTTGHGQSLVRHIPSGAEGGISAASLLAGTHPSWSPECKSRKDLTAEDWTLRLAESGMRYEVIKYAGALGQSLVRHRPSGTEGKARGTHLLRGQHPSWSPECRDPSNENPRTLLYLCMTDGYGQSRGFKIGRFITFGISRNTPEQRYGDKSRAKHIRTLKQSPRGLNRATMEKLCLGKMTQAFGPPDAGREAWLWDEEREAGALIIWDEIVTAALASESKGT